MHPSIAEDVAVILDSTVLGDVLTDTEFADLVDEVVGVLVSPDHDGSAT
jgi:hypothetical protein